MSQVVKDLKVNEEDVNPDIEKDTFKEESVNPIQDNKKTGSRQVLKQVKLADAITGKGGSSESSAPGLAGRSFGSYGGDATNISADMSSASLGRGDSRSETRYGRKLDPTVKAINTLGAEKVLTPIKGAPSLKDDPSAVQGGLSRRMNDNLIMSKTAGQSPASPLYQRSVDEIRRDELFYGTGQTVRADQDLNEDFHYGTRKGDYLPKTLTVRVNPAGYVEGVNFEVDDITAYANNPDVRDAASKHLKTHLHSIENVRRNIESTAGDESKEGWSPLGSAIARPNAVLSYLKDLEQDTGNHLYMANRFTKLASSYQLNRVGKDGVELEAPILESLLQQYYRDQDYDFYSDLGIQSDLFNRDRPYFWRSPAVLIALGDTVTKYKNKGDILNLPRSLKMYLNAGNNYINDLYMNPILKKAIENSTAFSTLDGNYDPLKPTLITDSVQVTSPIDWSNLGISFIERQTNVEQYLTELMDTYPIYNYEYADYRTRYVQILHHPIILGLTQWLLNNQDNIVATINRFGGFPQTVDKTDPKNPVTTYTSFEWVIPIDYSTTYFTTWGFLLNAAAHDIRQMRLRVLRDVIKYEEFHSYPFDDLVKFSSNDTTQSKNFTFQGINEPIKIGKLDDSAIPSWIMPEMFIELEQTDESDTLLVAPWYMSVEGSSNCGLSLRDRYMNWPFIREGIVMEGLDTLDKLGPRFVRLSLDVLVQIPGDMPIIASYTSDPLMAGIPVIDATEFDLAHADFYSTPRELGIKVVRPGGDSFTSLTSYRAKIYVSDLALIDSEVQLHDSGTPKVLSRGLRDSQHWYYYSAVTGVSDDKLNYLVLGLGDLLGTKGANRRTLLLEDGVGVRAFIPELHVHSTSRESTMMTMAGYFWTRLQILPFVISPFDIHNVSVGSGLSEDSHRVDPFQIPTMFGYAGMDTTEYTEDQYNRLDKELVEGLSFTSDLWIIDTPILK